MSKESKPTRKPRTRRKQAKGSPSGPKFSKTLEEMVNANRYVINGKVNEVEYDRMGRPTVMTPLVVQKLEDAFVYDATVEEACLYAGIAKQTYYNFTKEHPDFLDRVEDLRQASIIMLRRTVLSESEVNPDTALKYLERKRKSEFSLRTEVAHSGEVVNRHSIDPKTAELIRTAMGNFARKVRPSATP